MNEQKEQTIRCHKISPGKACGEVLISTDDICFYLVDPESGVVIEKGHALEGQCIAGKILVFPSGKGSSVVQADGLFQLKMKSNEPKALIVQSADTVLVASAIIMNIPLVNQVDDEFYRIVRNGDEVEVDADNSLIRIRRN